MARKKKAQVIELKQESTLPKLMAEERGNTKNILTYKKIKPLDEHCMDVQVEIMHAKDKILSLLKSDKLNKRAFDIGIKNFHICIDEDREYINKVIEMLQLQYNELSITKILKKHTDSELIEIINKIAESKMLYKQGLRRENIDKITLDEVETFRKYTKKNVSLMKTKLNTKNYLKMVRIAYDSTYDWQYPDEISTTYLFCQARSFSYEHEYKNGILGGNWNSTEDFERQYTASYHPEELYFGGITLTVQSLSDGKWYGITGYHGYRDSELVKTIKMYNSLRKKGYSIYFSNADVVYREALQIVKVQGELQD